MTCRALCLEDVGSSSDKDGQSSSWPSYRHAECADSMISQRICALLGIYL